MSSSEQTWRFTSPSNNVDGTANSSNNVSRCPKHDGIPSDIPPLPPPLTKGMDGPKVPQKTIMGSVRTYFRCLYYDLCFLSATSLHNCAAVSHFDSAQQQQRSQVILHQSSICERAPNVGPGLSASAERSVSVDEFRRPSSAAETLVTTKAGSLSLIHI